MKGDVVVIPFPFSDLSASKRRSALVVGDWGGADVMFCQITSQAKRGGVEIHLTAGDFNSGGLPFASHIRLNKIFAVERSLILYVAGKVNEHKYQQVVRGIVALIS